jgi:predicted Zn-dependent protease
MLQKTLLYSYILVLGITISVRAQSNEPVILRAMQDELKRSMTELKYEGHEAPFFISYGIADVTNYSAYAILGALVQSGEYKNRDKSVRILVGNYEFNDESLNNNSYNEKNSAEVALPTDDDYNGIRRALWATTDAVYKGAAEQYKKHQATLKEKDKKIADVPHRELAKVPVVKKIEAIKSYSLDKAKWDNYCRQLSAVFTAYPDLKSSKVSINISQGTQYFVNSEGTTVVIPFTRATLHCRIEAKNKNGDSAFDNIGYQVNAPDDLPPIEKVQAEAKSIAERLLKSGDEITLEDDYTGPVLFIGAATAQIFSNIFLTSRDGLMATDNIPNINENRPDAGNTMDNRIGKIVLDNSISIYARAPLHEFNGETLLGSYNIDEEGVVPADQLVLVEKGTLKNLMNDRSISRPGQTATGHANGPGVLEVVSDKGISQQALKQALIETARKEGLDFAIIVRESSESVQGVSQFYKVDLTTGKEELMRRVRLSSVALKNLKRIAGISKQQRVYTSDAGSNGLVSFIVPDALLLNDMELSPVHIPAREPDVTYIESPLKSIQN